MTGRQPPPANDGPPNITRDTTGEPLPIPPASLGPPTTSQLPPTQPPTTGPAPQPATPASELQAQQATTLPAGQATQEATVPAGEQPEALDANDVRLLTLMGEPGALKAAIDLDLVHADSRTRQQIVEFLQLTAAGDRFVQAEETTGLRWPMFRGFTTQHPKLHAIYEFAKGLGKSMRQCRREMELDRRGMEGIEKAVFYKGVQVATIREYSDKCLELSLKGGDVDGKYADRQKTETTTKGVIYHIIGVDRTPVERPERPPILGE